MSSFNIDNFQQRSIEIKLKFLTIFTFMALGVLTFFSIFFMKDVYFPLAVAEWITMLGLSINYLYMRRSKNTELASYWILLFVGAISLAVYTQGGMSETGNLWIVVFPLLAFYLLGERKGSILIAIFTLSLLCISTLIVMNIIEHPFEIVKVRNTLIVYIVVVVLSYFNEKLKMLATKETTFAYRNLRKVFEKMQDTYYRVDMKGKIEVISDSGYKLMGYPLDDVIGSYLPGYYYDRKERYSFFKKYNENSGKVVGFEMKLRHKNGHPVWILMNAQYIYDKEGNCIGSEGTVTDISAYKKMQEDLIELNTLLEERVQSGIDELRERDQIMLQQAKFAQMGELLAMIAHQWRQPLSAVAAITSNLKISMALEEEITPKTLLENFDNIDEHISLLSGTIDDFRNFFRSDKKRSKVDLDVCINKALFVLKPAISRHSIALHVESDFSTTIDSLQSEIIQVLINIINNAIDILSEQDSLKKISVVGRSENSSQVIEVLDNAGGIDDAIIEKIFEPYFSTKQEKNGTGLGLYMSKTIIEEHCTGLLEVENSEDGACFRITLPNDS